VSCEAHGGYSSRGVSIIEGNDINPSRESDVILGKGLAAALKAKTGDSLMLMTRTEDESINARDVRVSGIYISGSQMLDDYTLRLTLNLAKELVRTDGIQLITVHLKNTRDTGKAKAAIQRILDDNKLDLEVKSWEDISDFYQKARLMLERWFIV